VAARAANAGLRAAWRQWARLRGMALSATLAYKARSLFVILGVGFGVAALTLIVTAVDGAERTAVELVEWFGPDAALVFGGNFKKQAIGMRFNTITEEDMRGIRQSLPGVTVVVPMRAKQDVPLRYQDRNVPAKAWIDSPPASPCSYLARTGTVRNEAPALTSSWSTPPAYS